MAQKTEIITAISTLGCAISIGFVMQSGEIAELRYGANATTEKPAPTIVGKPAVIAVRSNLLPSDKVEKIDVSTITLTSADVDVALNVVPSKLLLDATATNFPHEPTNTVLEITTPEMAECTIKATAEPDQMAMVKFHIQAPCLGASRVIVSQNGLTFTDTLTETGDLDLILPALTRDVQIGATFLTGESVFAKTKVNGVSFFDRIILQSQSDPRIQLHAFEAGAEYGEEGHIWAGSTQDLSEVSDGTGGFITLLGDSSVPNALLAEVYSFQSKSGTERMDVDLTVEAEITTANCGKEIHASALEFKAGKKQSVQDLTLTVPNCDAVGSFLVLNNLLQDLKVASK